MNSKYIKYAIGEIVLVVIGILIALSINNWNENRKDSLKKEQYKESLIADLNADVSDLQNKNTFDSLEMAILYNLIERISSENANYDTLKKIALKEYYPYFDPSNELNRNTINALMSTGEIGLFNPELRDAISGHQTRQMESIKRMDQNVDIFLNTFSRTQFGPSETPLASGLSFRGKYKTMLWDAIDELQLARSLEIAISSKLTMLIIITNDREELINDSKELLTLIQSN